MKELLVKTITENIREYEELLELYKAEKQEIVGDVKKVERLKKLVAKAEIDGVTLDVPLGEDKSERLGEIEESIKCVKSVLRRFDTICEMYNVDISQSVEV